VGWIDSKNEAVAVIHCPSPNTYFQPQAVGRRVFMGDSFPDKFILVFRTSIRLRHPPSGARASKTPYLESPRRHESCVEMEVQRHMRKMEYDDLEALSSQDRRCDYVRHGLFSNKPVAADDSYGAALQSGAGWISLTKPFSNAAASWVNSAGPCSL
jgi:hypothetical protein